MTARGGDDVVAAAGATVVRPVALVFLDFLSEPVYVNSTDFTITWDGHDWLGAARVGGIGEVEESIDSKSSSLTVTLSGVDQESLAKAIGDRYQGRTGRMYTALLNEAYEVIGDPVIEFEGPMDTMPIKVASAQASIGVVISDGRADWERPSLRLYTNEDQQLDFPGDLGCEFVPQMVEKNIQWGS